MSLEVFLLDGTYELFRHFYALPSQVDRDGREVAATVGVLGSVVGMLESGVTHLGVATDHVIESFRNDLWPGYKTSAGMDPALLQQFPLLEDGLRALGVVVWPMVEFEADDALGASAKQCAALDEVDRVLICTPDKDLGQCVVGTRVVQFDRRFRKLTDEEGVHAKFGVGPASIPDYLGLVGDSADGFPGLPGWGAKSAAAVLARYVHLESIPPSVADWDVSVRGADKLAAVLREQMDLALLFRQIATIRADAPIEGTPDVLRWRGPAPELAALTEQLNVGTLLERVQRLKPL
jgi:5'-3' exonuclease